MLKPSGIGLGPGVDWVLEEIGSWNRSGPGVDWALE